MNKYGVWRRCAQGREMSSQSNTFNNSRILLRDARAIGFTSFCRLLAVRLLLCDKKESPSLVPLTYSSCCLLEQALRALRSVGAITKSMCRINFARGFRDLSRLLGSVAPRTVTRRSVRAKDTTRTKGDIRPFLRDNGGKRAARTVALFSGRTPSVSRYGKRFLFSQTLLSLSLSLPWREFVVSCDERCMYIDRYDHPTWIKRVGKCKRRESGEWATLRFESIGGKKKQQDRRATRK